MEQETEMLNSSNEQETLEVETNVEETTEDVADTSSELETLKQKNKELFARAKRAEGFVLEDGKWVKKQKPAPVTPKEDKSEVITGYSLSDLHALNKVHEDDVSKVENFAKREGLSIVEALKNEDLQAILDRRAEQRKTAEATNTKKVGGGGGKIDPDVLWGAAESGKLIDPVELAKARIAQKMRKIT